MKRFSVNYTGLYRIVCSLPNLRRKLPNKNLLIFSYASIEFDKKTRKTVCKPSTKDIIISLSDPPAWYKILCTHTNENHRDAITELIAEDFFRKDKRLFIGKIAKELNWKIQSCTN